MSTYEVQILWNGRVFTVRVTDRGSDFARKYVQDLHPGCTIIGIRIVHP